MVTLANVPTVSASTTRRMVGPRIGSAPPSHRIRRPGFTLVELLVVITIIAVLAALLIPAVYFAVARAKLARITAEMAGIQRGLDNYKLKMGEYPPDFTHDPTLGTPRGVQVLAAVNAHMAKAFRNRVPATPAAGGGNLAGDFRTKVNLANGIEAPALAADIANLDPAEALYFWLGGFSPDPTSPLSGAGDRQPFYEFDKSRLTDIDSDGFPEYHPQGDLEDVPMLYFKARPTGSEATAYAQVEAFANWAASTSPAGIPGFLPLPYYTARQVPNPGGGGGTVNAAAASRTYQLLSAGLDGTYGPGGLNVNDAGKDDLANFAEGTIEDFFEDQK